MADARVWTEEADQCDEPESSDDVVPEPGYSPKNEIQYFVSKGIPLGLSALANWGIPPVFVQLMAGQTEDSAQLQAALGFGRVFYVCTTHMVLLGLMSYTFTMVPGCVGAGRLDRIAGYTQRSMLLCAVTMAPVLVLQLFAGSIMEALGVESLIAAQAAIYCRLMIVSSCLLILELHLQAVFISLGYARAAAFNSLLSGVAVDMLCAYWLIYRWGLGVRGAAYTQIGVKMSRIAVWLVLMSAFQLKETIWINRTENLLVRSEIWIFVQQTAPRVMAHFSGWLVFELQLLALANIQGITPMAITAGAIWVQMESILASIQTGWCESTSIRTLTLLASRTRTLTKLMQFCAFYRQSSHSCVMCLPYFAVSGLQL